MPQAVLSKTEFRTLVLQQGLTCSEAEFSEFYEAYVLVRAMASRIRKPLSHMVDPAMTFQPLQSPHS